MCSSKGLILNKFEVTEHGLNSLSRESDSGRKKRGSCSAKNREEAVGRQCQSLRDHRRVCRPSGPCQRRSCPRARLELGVNTRKWGRKTLKSKRGNPPLVAPPLPHSLHPLPHHVQQLARVQPCALRLDRAAVLRVQALGPLGLRREDALEVDRAQ